MHSSFAPVALGAVLVAVVVGADSTAVRAQDWGDLGGLYNKFMDVVGLNDPGADINYGARSPLVIPPTRNLPAPGSDAPPLVSDWPKDPDMTRSKHAKAKEKPGPHEDWAVSLSQPLRPDQLQVPGAHAAGGGGSYDSLDPDHPERLQHPEGGVFGLSWFKKQQYATFTGEPPRGSLTDPPPGYLTPSPDQPYGVGSEQKKYVIPTVASRMEPER
jgi:hypothetical protein